MIGPPRFQRGQDGGLSDMQTEQTQLRDQLALERTHLANERTLLAYIRTGFALAAGAAALLHFFPQAWSAPAALFLFAGAALALLFGTWRFWRVRRRLG